MFGIVWFHAGIDAGRVIAHGGLFFFIIVSVYFAVSSRRRHRVAERAVRLLAPCSMWAALYGLISFFRRGHCFPEGYNLPSMILATSSIHLWYLPFMFFVLVAVDTFQPLLSRRNVVAAAGCGAVVVLALSPLWQDIRLADPFVQYIYSVPAVLIGIFLGHWRKIGTTALVTLLAALLVTLTVLVASLHSEVGTLYLAGLLPCLFLLYDNRILRANRMLLELSSAVFGIYLMHPFWQMVLRYLGLRSFLLPVTVFAVSLVAVMLARRILPRQAAQLIGAYYDTGGIGAGHDRSSVRRMFLWRPYRSRA